MASHIFSLQPVQHPAVARLNDSSEIQGAFHLFYGFTRHTMGIDHRSPNIAMTEKGLYGADVVVGLFRFLRTGNILVIAKIFLQNMPVQKQ